MDNKNYIIIGLVVIIVLVVAGLAYAVISTNNASVNNTTVTANNTTAVSTGSNSKSSSTSSLGSSDSVSSDSGSSGNDVVSVEDHENFQAGDGSHYDQVNYADGHIRQYDKSGNLIGSDYESDQPYLMNKYND